MKNETETQYIDATPTWVEILPVLLAADANGSADARAELLRLAAIADRCIAQAQAHVAARKGGAL
jgi:hypothetical protein